MIDILAAARQKRDVADGCTTHVAALPAPFAPAGVQVVQFDSLAPQAACVVAAPAGALRLAVVLDGMLSCNDGLGGQHRVLGGEAVLLEAADPVQQTFENESSTDTVELVSLYGVGARTSRCVQRYFSDDARRGRLCPVLTGDGSGDSLQVDGSLTVSVASLAAKGSLVVPTPAGHQAAVCAMSGGLSIEGRLLERRALALVSGDAPALHLTSEEPAEVMVVLAGPTRE
ncbi:MAG: hypothetical protein AAFN78_00550 [Pseudomonadota bacterium]